MRGFEKIDIAGTVYPVNFGTNAIRNFEEYTGIASDEISDKGSLTANMLYLIYFGLKDGARREKKDFKLTIEEVADMLDEDGEKKEGEETGARKIANLWLRSNGYPEIGTEEEKEVEEKKTKPKPKRLTGKK